MSAATALVTGSTSGIGLAVAKALARMNLNVMLNGFGTQAEIDAATSSVAAITSGHVSYTPADLTKAQEVEGLIRATHSRWGRLDVLVNNAGIQHMSPVDEFPDDKWNQIMALNLSAVFHGTKHALPIMKRQNFGRIINVASVHGHVASANKAPYVAAKHGVIGFTKAVALEVATYNITVNAVCPGWVLTPLGEKQSRARMEQHNGDYDTATTQLGGEKMPSKKCADVEEIGMAVAYLATPATKSTTGTSMIIDGGWTAQ